VAQFCTVSKILWVIWRKSRYFYTSPAFSVLLGVISSEFRNGVKIRKLEWGSQQVVNEFRRYV